MGLAAGRPVAVTPLPIFQDVAEIVHQLPGTTAAEITVGIRELIKRICAKTDQDVTQKSERQRQFQIDHSLKRISQQLGQFLDQRGLRTKSTSTSAAA
jgi:hypothetical protein